jgi:hypothetical protein
VKETARAEEMRSTKTLFKMSKFKNIGPKTNSHNSGLRRALSYAVLSGTDGFK